MPVCEEATLVESMVSTIIPVYNRAALLTEAVESVLSQSYRPIEVIIVDDGSTDDTSEVCDELQRRHKEEIRVLRQPNAGPGPAREAGRKLARGEFIQYLDSDDVLLPEKFRLQTEGLKAHPECGVSYGKTRYRHGDGRHEAGAWKGSGEKVETMFPSFLLARWWDTPTPLYRASLCEQAPTRLLVENVEEAAPPVVPHDVYPQPRHRLDIAPSASATVRRSDPD